MNAAAGEHDGAVGQSEKRVIVAPFDHAAGEKSRAALTHDDGADAGLFPAVKFDSAKLRVGIAAVLCGSLPLFMSHIAPVLKPDIEPRSIALQTHLATAIDGGVAGILQFG